MYVYDYIVKDPARIKLINGCAGSAKTTLLINCGMTCFFEKKNVIFLTKIGSVTDEIKTRIESIYNLDFTRSSNHFLTEKDGYFIEVANFDAFVDKQLKMYKFFTDGGAFNNKVERLTEKMEVLEYSYLKNDIPVDAIFIDEVQDFDKVRLQFIVKLLQRQQRLHCVMVGDTMQTIFKQSLVNDQTPFFYLSENLPEDMYYHTLTKCYRCPEPHVKFVNEILGEYYTKQNIPPVTTDNKLYEHKPVLFQHGALSTEKARGILAKNIIYFIKFILTYDKEIQPDDIVILMNKTNANALFEKIIVFLRQFYKEFYGRNEDEYTIHYETKQADGRVTIDWDIGKNKTKLMSIHGDKGKGHKVVILVGMSEKSIPMPEALFKPEELIFQSVLNVGLTRSKKYLFVGFNSTPSRYIYDNLDKIEQEKLAYCTWNSNTWPDQKTVPFYYHLLDNIPNKKNKLKVVDNYVRKEVFTPTKNLMNVSYDIVQELHISDCLKQYQHLFDSMEKQTFGKRQFIPEDLTPPERAIVGIAVELAIQHISSKDRQDPKLKVKLFQHFLNKDFQFFYTDSQMILGDVHEMQMNRFVEEDSWFTSLQNLRKKYEYIPSLKAWFNEIEQTQKPVYILSDAWKYCCIEKTLHLYNNTPDIVKVPFESLWKLAIFYASLSGVYYMESIYIYLNSKIQHTLNPVNMYQNCKIYYQRFMKKDRFIEFQKDIKRTRTLFPGTELLKKMNYLYDETEKKYEYGILGICDAISETVEHDWILHEFKSSSKADDSKKKVWMFQTLIYIYLLQKFNPKKGVKPDKMSKIHIANLTSGVVFILDLSKVKISYNRFISSILSKKDFPQELIDFFI